MEHGSFINYQKSNFFTKDGRFIKENIIPLLGNGITNLINLVSMTYAFKYAKLGGINQGVLLTLNSLAAVYLLFIFYFLFKEKVTVIQSIGILLMLTCVSMIAINAKTQNESTDLGSDKSFYAILSILCGLCSPLALSTKHIFVR
jgi:drug/metabolite transporter (DMT)-like permease